MKLTVTNLGKQYRRDFWGLKDFSLEIGPGILGLLGPMNKVYEVDYLGANSNGNIGFFIPLSIVLIIAAFLGRVRQLQN